MTTYAWAAEGILAAQIGRLGPNKELLTGPEDRIVLPGEMLFDFDPELVYKTYSSIDVPGYERDERRRQRDYLNLTFNLATSVDAETLGLLGGVNTFGQNGFTYGIETLCNQLGCFCDCDEEDELYIIVWVCARNCKGGCLMKDPTSGEDLYGFFAFPCLRNVEVSEFPGVNRPGEAPDPWTLTATVYPNPSFGTGPGGIVKTDNPDGMTCSMARGLTDVPPPVDCDTDCTEFNWGLASGVEFAID